MNSQNILYWDSLVEITGDAIAFKNYYYPAGSKRVYFSDIDSIRVEKPTLLNGKWRLWGTGNLTTWFPKDWQRPSRSDIFFVRQRNSWLTIGFTVENSPAVIKILEDKKLIAVTSVSQG